METAQDSDGPQAARPRCPQGGASSSRVGSGLSPAGSGPAFSPVSSSSSPQPNESPALRRLKRSHHQLGLQAHAASRAGGRSTGKGPRGSGSGPGRRLVTSPQKIAPPRHPLPRPTFLSSSTARPSACPAGGRPAPRVQLTAFLIHRDRADAPVAPKGNARSEFSEGSTDINTHKEYMHQASMLCTISPQQSEEGENTCAWGLKGEP